MKQLKGMGMGGLGKLPFGGGGGLQFPGAM
jgi:hypothetical protein